MQRAYLWNSIGPHWIIRKPALSQAHLVHFHRAGWFRESDFEVSGLAGEVGCGENCRSQGWKNAKNHSTVAANDRCRVEWKRQARPCLLVVSAAAGPTLASSAVIGVHRLA